MSAFEPDAIIASLKLTLSKADASKFEASWQTDVQARVASWKNNHEMQSQVSGQLEWAAHVVQYVNYVWKLTETPANAKMEKPALSKNIAIYGPRFVPPSYLHEFKRSKSPKIHTKTTYLKPLNIVHPFYYGELRCCPRCGCTDKRVTWNGWNGTGYREVHGLRVEETALGFQLRCDACQKARKQFDKEQSEGGDKLAGSPEDSKAPGFCFATTSYEFWSKRHYWEIPLGIPYFFKRCAVTRDLFDLITEMCPTGTSGGLAHHVKQLHLHEYHQQRYTYLRHYKARRKSGKIDGGTPLEHFSKPGDKNKGYDLTSITDDLVTDVYLAFVEKSRQEESDNYKKTLAAICFTIDNTFHTSGKATVIFDKTTRMKF